LDFWAILEHMRKSGPAFSAEPACSQSPTATAGASATSGQQGISLRRTEFKSALAAANVIAKGELTANI
jgi:hypothetical protein